MEYFYYAKSKVEKWWQTVPPIPQNIGEVPLVAVGAAAITCITLAVVTLTDRSVPDDTPVPATSSSESSMSPSNIGASISSATSNVVESIKSAVTPAPAAPQAVGGEKKKHRKTRVHHRKKQKTQMNKTR